MWSIYTVSLLHIAFFIVIIMALHSTLHDFSGKDWLSYQERFGFYFQANYIDYSAAVKQQEILLSAIGTDTYTLLHSLAALNSSWPGVAYMRHEKHTSFP